MKALPENQKNIENAPRNQNRKIGLSLFRSKRDDYDFKNKPRNQNVNRKPVHEVEIRRNRKHYRKKNRASDEHGVDLVVYGKARFQSQTSERQHKYCHKAECRDDVAQVQKKSRFRKLVPNERSSDSLHANLIDEKENAHGENEWRVPRLAENPNENLRANRSQKHRD